MGMDSHDHDRGSSWQAMKMVIRELLKGQDSATRLQALLQLKESLPPDQNYSGPVKELLVEVLSSVSRAISLLGTEMTAEAPLGHANLLSSDEHKSESSRKIRRPPRRSGYRRRSHPYTCRTVYAKDIEDGYTWRKYGQKIIYGTTHQRSYYRCTHKFDRECHATRQVQKTEDASMFAITYMGEHTCMDATESAAPNCIISFKSGDTANTHREAPLFSAPFLPSLKLECEEEMLSSHSPRSASSELLVLPDLSDLEGSAPAALFTGGGGASDQYDVTSSIQSPTSSLEMEFDPETFMFDHTLDFGDIN